MMLGSIKSRRDFALLMTVVVGLLQCAVSQTGLPLDQIVARMERAQVMNHDNAIPYKVVRKYELSKADKDASSGEVFAEVTVQPPAGRQYVISKSSGGQAERVARHVLDREAEMAPQWERAALMESNYSFEYAGTESIDGHTCYVLTMKPKRDTSDLMRGRAWIDAQNFNIRQISGEPAKMPSWWIKHLEVTLHFTDISGQWLQTNYTASADVRFAGKHSFNSTSLSFEMKQEVANNSLRTRPARTTMKGTYQNPLAGTAVVLPAPR